MKMRRNLLIFLLCLIFAGIAIFSGYEIVKTLLEYKAGEDAYNQLQQYVSVAEPTDPVKDETPKDDPGRTEADQGAEATVPVVVVDENRSGIHVDFDALHKINSDIVGWIYLEDSKINFPVVQGIDNQEYLYHLINGDYNGSGTPFVDYRNAPDFSDPHTIIYGHNMKNRSMFGNLKFLKEQERYDKNPYFWILTPEGNYRYKIFAAFDTSYKSDVYTLFSIGGSDFLSWEKSLQKQSAVKNDVKLRGDDFTVTLSTCTGDSSVRCVIIGKCVSSDRPDLKKIAKENKAEKEKS
jgi:sortase B